MTSETLSPHFLLVEFEKDGPIPAECLPVFRALATLILEPIRLFLGESIAITSGYRPDEVNKAIHGAAHSEHVATPRYCAADFTFNTLAMSVRRLFDWIRTNPTLPFHQVILEHGATGSSIIHISIDLDKLGDRQALEGATYNASGYSKHDVAVYAGILELQSGELEG